MIAIIALPVLFGASYGGAISSVCLGQTSPKKKPGQVRPIAGTKPINREKAELGVVYTLGKGEYKLNFKFIEAWYSLVESRPTVALIAGENQKLLTMRVEIQNPTNRDIYVNGTTLDFTDVGADNQTVNPGVDMCDAVTLKPIVQDLRPAQKIQVLATITIPETGPVYKLFTVYAGDKPIVFDLRGKAKDNVGAWSAGDGIVKKEIEAKVGDTFGLDEWGVTIDKKVDPIPAEKDADGNETKAAVPLQLFVRVKNLCGMERYFSCDFSTYLLEDENGQSSGEAYCYYGATDQAASTQIQPGKELKLRLVFANMAGKLVSLSISKDGRLAKMKL